MAIPLWRQYTRLSADQRREILERRRRRLDEASNRQEVLDAFLADARDVRARYAGRNRTRPEADAPDAGSDGGQQFAPSTIEDAQRLGLQPGALAEARNRVNAALEARFNRRQQTVPASQRQRYTRPRNEVLDAEIARLQNR